MTVELRGLELFSGIGGFAAAAKGSNLRIMAAMDQDRDALDTYRLNYPQHTCRRVDLERVSAWELSAGGIDFWWLSPPCQPYCERGARRDLADPRARSLVRILELLATMRDEHLPRHLALENVAGFVGSQAHGRLREVLTGRGYHLAEHQICPTMLGVPSRRPRYYLAASRAPLVDGGEPAATTGRPLADYLAPELTGSCCPDELLLDRDLVERFGSGLRILDPSDPVAYTTCFISGYGRSLMGAGSYLRCADGVRRFSPEEIARLLHFPPDFRFPPGLSLRKRWHLVGNSLSVAAVRHILGLFPAIRLACGNEPRQLSIGQPPIRIV